MHLPSIQTILKDLNDIPESSVLAAFKRHYFPDKQTNLYSENDEAAYLFHRFASKKSNCRGLALQFGHDTLQLIDENWTTLDLAAIERDAKQTCEFTLKFPDEHFDRVLCTHLDRASQPVALATEVRRILKRSGQVWAQAPIRAGLQLSPSWESSYRGFTPAGLKVLFERFDEILCSRLQAVQPRSRRDSFFYGIKPEIAAESINDSTKAHGPVSPAPVLTSITGGKCRNT